MDKFKELLKDNKIITILCIFGLCTMLFLTIFEMFGSEKVETEDSSSIAYSSIDSYLSLIEGVGNSSTYISYDKDNNPIGAIVICKNLNKDTESKIKIAIHTITGISISKICVFQASNIN